MKVCSKKSQEKKFDCRFTLNLVTAVADAKSGRFLGFIDADSTVFNGQITESKKKYYAKADYDVALKSAQNGIKLILKKNKKYKRISTWEHIDVEETL